MSDQRMTSSTAGCTTSLNDYGDAVMLYGRYHRSLAPNYTVR